MASHKFKDADGREWSIVLDVYNAEAVQEQCGVDLFSLFADDQVGAAKLFANVRKTVDVLYVLCKEQADVANIDDIGFGRAIRGDAIQDATNALLQGVANFYPTDQRLHREAMILKATVATTQVNQKILAAIEAIDPSTFFDAATKSH